MAPTDPESHENGVCVQDGDSSKPPNVDRGAVDAMEYSTTSASGIAVRETSVIQANRQAKRNREPLWLCKQIVTYPKTFFALTLSGHLLFFFVTLVMLRIDAGYILPIKFERLPLDIRDHPDYLRDLAWQNRFEDGTIIERGAEPQFETSFGMEPERSQVAEVMQMCFDMGTRGNVFTKENLKKIQEVENAFFKDSTFQEKYCLLNSDKNCTSTRSILRFFDGTFKIFDSVFDDPDFGNIQQVLMKANNITFTKRALQYHLGKDAIIDSSGAFSPITRSLLFFGLPLEGYQNASDRETEQTDMIKKFISETFAPKADAYFKSGAGEMDFFYNSISLLFSTISSLIFQDFSLAIGSLIFIIIFMCIQTGSLWVSLWANFSIITSFCCTNLIYRVVLDFRYFGTFHILAVFIILGIGADDVFVFFDTWKESKHHSYASLAHRLSDCYRKAAKAMLFTSVTTATAFIVSATSPFLGIYSFGVFAGILVFVNYVSVITYFPTVIATYHLYFEKYKCCCCCPAIGSSVNDEETASKDLPVHRKHPIVKFFRGPYFRFVTHRIARWAILAFFAVFLGIFIYFSAQLKVNEEQIKFLSDDTNFGKFIAKLEAFDTSGSEQIQVSLVWGLNEQDIGQCHHTDEACTGKTMWNDKFDINAPNAQESLLALCDNLMNLTQYDIDAMMVSTDVVTGKPEVACFIKDMKQDLDDTGALSIPIGSEDSNQILKNTALFSKSLPPGYNNHFEIVMAPWLSLSPERLMKYGQLLGETSSAEYTQTVNVSSQFGAFPFVYGTQLKFAAIVINTTQTRSMGYPSGLPVREAWNNFLEKQMQSMPDSLKGGFATSSGVWHWYKIQETLTSSAIIGIVIGLVLAFPILVIATHNIIVGLMATLAICCVVVTVVGFIPMAGWKLGLLESLNLVLVVGLAVDYVVHLAEGYSRSSHVDRLGRTRDALEEVGISVLSGAATTLGAAFFLLFAQVLFFLEFGAFLFCTLGASILYSLGLFITLVAMIGPEGETGSLHPLYRWCGRKLSFGKQ